MKLYRAILAGMLLSLAAGYSAQAAGISGTQALAAVVNSPYGDVQTQASFTLNPTLVFGASTGDFVGYPQPDSLGLVTITRASLDSFTFGNATFGTFTTNPGQAIEIASPDGTATFKFGGLFTPGSAFTGLDPAAAEVLVNLTQVGGHFTAISFSGTLSIVPEPSSAVLAGIGLASLGMLRPLRKRFGR
ncbi:MAG: hypothetical protein U0790_01900 [Isosphaeraceae bacterium]